MSSIFCVAVLAFALSAWAQGAKSGCKDVQGTIVWTVIPAPNDPFGRVLGSVTGTLRGASSAIILEPPSAGPAGISTHDLDIFVTGAQDVLVGDAHATFVPVQGKPGTVQDTQTITITGGTGKFDGATGSLQVKGTGYNFPPTGGVGIPFFRVQYKGQVCNAKWDGTEESGGDIQQ